MKRLIIFTDLDGTLLDYYTYSFEPALPALALVRERGVPLVLCSSKTRSEIEYFRRKIGNDHPFISENGGGIFIPRGYFGFEIADGEAEIFDRHEYHVLRLGKPYSEMRNAVLELRESGFEIKGFGDMTASEIASIAGMSLEEAAMAKKRDFDEPFSFAGGPDEIRSLTETIAKRGLTWTCGRFFHIMGDINKGRAVSILTDFYRKAKGDVTTVAIGDRLNDLPMLRVVNIPVVVRKEDGTYESGIELPNLIKAEGIGPVGWNEALFKILSV